MVDLDFQAPSSSNEILLVLDRIYRELLLGDPRRRVARRDSQRDFEGREELCKVGGQDVSVSNEVYLSEISPQRGKTTQPVGEMDDPRMNRGS